MMFYLLIALAVSADPPAQPQSSTSPVKVASDCQEQTKRGSDILIFSDSGSANFFGGALSALAWPVAIVALCVASVATALLAAPFLVSGLLIGIATSKLGALLLSRRALDWRDSLWTISLPMLALFLASLTTTVGVALASRSAGYAVHQSAAMAAFAFVATWAAAFMVPVAVGVPLLLFLTAVNGPKPRC